MRRKSNNKINGNAAEQSAQKQTEEIVGEVEVTPRKERIWEVDFLRGFMILFVVWDHFMWDVYYFGSAPSYRSALFKWLYSLANTYYDGTLRAVTHDVFVTMFVFTSGVSCSFSRNNGKRALKMIAFASLLTLITYILSAVSGVELTIYFNVIHVVALSVLLWSVAEFFWSKCSKNWQKNIFGVVMTAITLAALVAGSCAKYSYFNNNAWKIGSAGYFLFYCKNNVFIHGGDFLPFLPDFGWFLVGAFLGKAVYKQRKSIFPSVNAKYLIPITFCGRYSVWVYFGSQVFMFGVIYMLHTVLCWI